MLAYPELARAYIQATMFNSWKVKLERMVSLRQLRVASVAPMITGEELCLHWWQHCPHTPA